LEAIAHDYAPKGVRFYYIYKALAHPESGGGYVQPYTLEERLMHVKEAEKRIDGVIPWLCDTITNDVMHALGNAPMSDFVIGPDGKIARKRAWCDVRALRKDLEELVGPIDNPTKAEDLDLKIAPSPKVAARGVVERVKVPNSMKPLVVRPEPDPRGTPHYAKLRADTDEALLTSGNGQLYLGFHLDPIYRVHWNNLTKPIHVDVEAPAGVEMPKSLDGPKIEQESDADPREFVVDISGWTSAEPIRLTVRYFGCSDEPAFCVPVTQQYAMHRKLDVDSGWARGRVDPSGLFHPLKPEIASGRVVEVDVEAGNLTIRTRDEKTLDFRIDRETRFEKNGKRTKLSELKANEAIRVEFFVRKEGPLARQVRAKPDKPDAKEEAARKKPVSVGPRSPDRNTSPNNQRTKLERRRRDVQPIDTP